MVCFDHSRHLSTLLPHPKLQTEQSLYYEYTALTDHSLDTLESERAIKSLNSKKLNGRSGSKSSPNGDEPSPEGCNSTLFYKLSSTITKSIVKFDICRLVHESGTDPVKGRDGQGHEKASQSGRTKDGSDIFSIPSSRIGNVTLGNIIATHLGGVEHTGAHNVGLESSVKATDSLLGIHISHQCSERHRFSLVGLRQGLHDIEWVSKNAADTTCDGSSKKLEVEWG